MIWALLRQFWPYLAAIALAVGAWAWHTGAVDDAFESGKAEVQGRWNEADRVAVEVGAAKSKLLARNAIKESENLHEKLIAADRRAAVIAADRARVLDGADGMRNELERRAAASPSSDPAGASCGGYETKLQRCEGLLAGSLALAQGARGLVDQAEGLLERSEAALESLQRWAVIVQGANEAP
jgi:hypothetical protein